MSYNVDEIRSNFPILSTEINGNPLVYFDNGASAQKPQVVIDAILRGYQNEYANVHRGLHTLSGIATERYEGTRKIVADFLNVDERNVVFTTGSTEGLNLVSYSWGASQLKAGDEIILSVAEHHGNIIPWHFLRERIGITLKWVDVDDDGSLPAQRVIDAIGANTKLVAISQMSNVTGVPVDVKTIAEFARGRNIRVLIDGSQAAVHAPVDVADLGVDFYVITGHKLYGPTGSGAVYVSDEAYLEMRPFMGGGDMISTVEQDRITYAEPPMRFEAGTPGIVETIGLGVALSYLQDVGMDKVAAHEAELSQYCHEALKDLNFVRILGDSENKKSIFTIDIPGVHAHDISTIVDQKGVAIRAGTHCAQPLMERFGVTSSVRASLGMYNTKGEVDAFIDALKFAYRLLG
ncbi:UNVERIFIED_CONTAM: hypothetical protein GTU68_009346 [Idotea baltica]|nr:hypothetical protein [Idotea baltica]